MAPVKPDLRHISFQDLPNEIGHLQALLPYSNWEVRATPIPSTQINRVTILRHIKVKGTKYAEVMLNVTMTQQDVDYAKNWCERNRGVNSFNSDRFCLDDQDLFKAMLHKVKAVDTDLLQTVS